MTQQELTNLEGLESDLWCSSWTLQVRLPLLCHPASINSVPDRDSLQTGDGERDEDRGPLDEVIEVDGPPRSFDVDINPGSAVGGAETEDLGRVPLQR